MTNTRTAEITTILFDAGNTLVFVDLVRVGRVFENAGIQRSSEELETAERAARAAMYRVSEENATIRDRDRWETYTRAMLEATGMRDDATVAAVHDELLALDRRENLWTAVPPDTVPLLEELSRRGFRLGVVSNADGRVPALLGKVGLADYFETVIDSHLVGVEKPEPRIFELALEALGVEARHTMYVGDSPAVDVVGARRAGLSPVLLDPLAMARDVDCPVIRSLGELANLLPEAAPR